MANDPRRDDDVELGLRTRRALQLEQFSGERDIAEQRHFRLGLEDILLGQSADDEGLAVANRGAGFGLAAAYDDTIGVIGVAPGAKVVAVRVLNRRGSGTNSGVIAGVDYVATVAQPGDVANMSLGGGVSTALDTAVVNASSKVRFALAAGNESDNANNHSPARANGTNIYTVSAVAVNDKWASYSNYGNPPVDIAEPGSSIKSTWLNGGYNTISGTSMATPHLAGILLAGAPKTDTRVAIGDPDGNPDRIGTR